MATLPPPAGTTEATPTGLKDREVPMTPSPAQYAPVTATEPRDVELEEGQVVKIPPTPIYPLIPSIEIDDEEVLSSSTTTQRVPLHANLWRRTIRGNHDGYVRSQSPSPEPASRQLGLVDNTPPRPDRSSRKRKRPEDAGPPSCPTPPLKKQKTSAGEDKKDNKFCWEVGQEFHGFVFHVDGEIAKEIARNIHKLPAPTKVHKRLIYFCDASIRSTCGAAGVVWQKSFGSSKWTGMGFHYPESTVSSATVELFAISCTMQMAIDDINTERGTVVQNQPVDTALFQQHSAHTFSHLHNLTKEVFIFTDDWNALRRIDGTLAYDPEGDMARQVEAISTHSKTLSELGVHVELHLSPGHSAVPGNNAADRVAKRKVSIAMAEMAVHELLTTRHLEK